MKRYDGVIFANTIQMAFARKQVERVFKTFKSPLTISAGMESGRIHSAGTLHYCGYAEDYTLKRVNQKHKELIYKDIKNLLALYSDYYDVIFEQSHIHVEYDIFRRLKNDGGIKSPIDSVPFQLVTEEDNKVRDET